MTSGFDGMLTLFVLLYADDIVILSESETGLQNGLYLLECYCDRWKLQVNISKTKAMIFKKGGRNRGNLYFTYKHEKLEIVKSFKYLGVFFTTGVSFNATYDSLHGQALKSLFKLKSYLIRFPNMTVIHKLDLFDKLIEPILN